MCKFPGKFKVEEDADADMGAGQYFLVGYQHRFPFVALVMFNIFGCKNPPPSAVQKSRG